VRRYLTKYVCVSRFEEAACVKIVNSHCELVNIEMIKRWQKIIKYIVL